MTADPTPRVRRDEWLPAGVQGTADPHFAAAVRGFAQVIARRPGGGALAVYQHGEPVVDVWAGTSDRDNRIPWQADTGAMVFSATKGMAATVIHRLADRGLIDYDTPVAEYWPEFAANGKSRMTVRTVLSHEAGLWDLSPMAAGAAEIVDHRLMEERIAAAKPDGTVGKPYYHAITFGWLLAGLARAVTGRGMAELFRTELADPLGIDGLYLGRPPVGAPTSAADFAGSLDWVRGPLVSTATRVPGLLRNAQRTVIPPGFEKLFAGTDPAILATELPAGNAVATARALAAVYSAIACGGTSPQGQFLTPERVRAATRIQNLARDGITKLPASWRLGYQALPIPGMPGVFGHPGLGGSGGLVYRPNGLAIGFVHNRLTHPRFVAHEAAIGLLAFLSARGARARDAGGAAPGWGRGRSA